MLNNIYAVTANYRPKFSNSMIHIYKYISKLTCDGEAVPSGSSIYVQSWHKAGVPADQISCISADNGCRNISAMKVDTWIVYRPTNKRIS